MSRNSRSALTQFFNDEEWRAKSAKRWLKWGGNGTGGGDGRRQLAAMEVVQGLNEWVGVMKKTKQTWSSRVRYLASKDVCTRQREEKTKEKAGWEVSDDLNVLLFLPCFVLMSVLWFVSRWRSHRCRSKCCLSIKRALWERLAASPEIHVVSPQRFNLASAFPLLLSAYTDFISLVCFLLPLRAALWLGEDRWPHLRQLLRGVSLPVDLVNSAAL